MIHDNTFSKKYDTEIFLFWHVFIHAYLCSFIQNLQMRHEFIRERDREQSIIVKTSTK